MSETRCPTDFEVSHFPFTVVRLFEQYGLYPGDFALCFLDCLVSSRGLDPSIGGETEPAA